ncbi:MAG TPA: response regulator transcription factor [Acidimicrobiales bacterium]|nr:response regulator transcription factor [Acidimicrobiales bacterium]
MTKRKTTVLLADDEPMILRLLHRLLDSHEHAEIVGEATDGLETLELTRSLEPDVIVLDHSMPGMTGMEVAERVLSENPDQRIILFSAMAQGELAERARQLGIATLAKTDVSLIVDLLAPGAL